MLKKENRLAKIIKRADGKKYFSPLFTIRISDNKEGKARFAFVVSKRIDKRAVVRNRTKRVLRVAAETFIDRLKGKDIVVIAKKSFSFNEKTMVAKELNNILKK